jgi:hypothetical protein
MSWEGGHIGAYAIILSAALGLPPPPEPTPRQRMYGFAASVLYAVAIVGLPLVCVPVFMWQAIHLDPQSFGTAIWWWTFGGLAAFVGLIAGALTLTEMSIPRGRK